MPDNTTHELPLSLVATDPQSSYGSTNSQVKQLTVETNKHHHYLQPHTHCKPMPGTFSAALDVS
ncbi:hypothetical protein Taro_008761 [Colocasia esculenta]|uniref:Uncharacterized protein n=1 Tax=Colocasia esculenta TaxID=4460 RepID=A0A843U365_COLES|nr:hypothetical protein [Colocasia esculenta]